MKAILSVKGPVVGVLVVVIIEEEEELDWEEEEVGGRESVEVDSEVEVIVLAEGDVVIGTGPVSLIVDWEESNEVKTSVTEDEGVGATQLNIHKIIKQTN